MKLLKIALLIVGIPLLAAGSEGIYHSVNNLRQISMTCQQFTVHPPGALWIHIAGCDIDYLGAGYRESNGRIDELFFPARPAAQPKTVPAALVVATRDPEALAIAQLTIGHGQQPDQEAFIVMMLRIVTMLKIAREVDGYVRSGLLERLRTSRVLSGLNTPVAPNAVVLDLHARPSLLTPGIEAAAGVVALTVALTIGRRRRAPADVDETALVPTLGTISELPGEPAARRLPAVMLLNLDAAAGAAEIERAPPLGRRSEVADRIASVLGTPRFDGYDRATLRGPDWSLAIDLGREALVWTVTVEPRGNGAPAALDALARGTGWRIFVPKQGTFIEPAQLEQVTRS